MTAAVYSLTMPEVQMLPMLHAHPEAPTIVRPSSRMSRARSNSEASVEVPEANAAALKGDIVHSPVLARIFGSNAEVPPVPPLPEGIQPSPTNVLPDASSAAAYHARDRSLGRQSNRRSAAPSLRNMNRAASDASFVKDDRRMLVHSLLNSIEVDDQNGDEGVGRPPY